MGTRLFAPRLAPHHPDPEFGSHVDFYPTALARLPQGQFFLGLRQKWLSPLTCHIPPA